MPLLGMIPSHESKVEEQSRLTVNSYVEFQKFVQKYAAPDNLKKLIEENPDVVATPCVRLGKPVKYICKGAWQIDRIINAERLRACIKKYGLNSLDVPKKYIYKVKDKWLVFADYVDSINQGETLLDLIAMIAKGSHLSFKECEAITNLPYILTLNEIQDLTVIAEELGYIDWTWQNLIRTPTGKLVFIDTEDGSFRFDWNKFELVRRLENAGFAMTDEAAQWLHERLAFLEKDLNGTIKNERYYLNKEFDGTDICVGHVVRQFYEERNGKGSWDALLIMVQNDMKEKELKENEGEKSPNRAKL
jgi:hypothetical protein